MNNCFTCYLLDLKDCLDPINCEKMEWISVKDRLPICYKTGHWDGKMSDLILCQDEKEDYHLAHCYEFRDEVEWYDKDDFGLRHEIIKWCYIS